MHVAATRKCKNCRNKFYVRKDHKNYYQKYCSNFCKVQAQHKQGLIGFELKGEKNPSWAGNKITYKGIHHWLNREFGKAKKCENCRTRKAKLYEWSKLKNKQYKRKRENFWQLCRSCHIIYDWSKRYGHGK